MRLFIGIELPLEVKIHIANCISPLKQDEKGWENFLDYHMTLLFIGETLEEKIPFIISRLKTITFLPFDLSIRTLCFFPRRVLYLSCYPSIELQKLKDTVLSIFPEYVRPEDKEFVPHITIKRYQRYEVMELEKKMVEHPIEAKLFVVDHLCLFKSEKDDHEVKYHVLERN